MRDVAENLTRHPLLWLAVLLAQAVLTLANMGVTRGGAEDVRAELAQLSAAVKEGQSDVRDVVTALRVLEYRQGETEAKVAALENRQRTRSTN